MQDMVTKGAYKMKIAIYSRKSKWTGKGDSIENQIQMCKEYILSNIEESKEAEYFIYEDEGFSGKNTDRPQFTKMMKDMKANHFDYLVCYKLDRLGRNIIDLANLMNQLIEQGTSFISIKEKFDTSSPIGRAMLLFSGVLAQMEREQIAERIRDNMYMLARDGRWLGGNTPLGFSSQKEEKVIISGKTRTSFRLVINEEEMDTVRFIYNHFLENRSLTQLVRYFLKNDIKTKRGKNYALETIKKILTNPVYAVADVESYSYFQNLDSQVCIAESDLDQGKGFIGYGKTSDAEYKAKETAPEEWVIALGKHDGIIAGRDWIKVQKILEINKKKVGSYRKVQNPVSLLSGLLYCDHCGTAMRPKNYREDKLTEKGERRFSYLCPLKDMTHGEKCKGKNINGNLLDKMVCKEVLKYADADLKIGAMLKEIKNNLLHEKSSCPDEGGMMQKELDEKRKQIQNLIHSLAQMDNTSISVDYVAEQIEKLDKECKELDDSLRAVKQEKAPLMGAENEIDYFIGILEDVSKRFETLSVVEKREYLRILLEKVTWDGENARVFIYSNHPEH